MRKFIKFLISCGVFMFATAFHAFAAEGIVIAENNTAADDLSIEAMVDGTSYILSPENEYRITFESETNSPQVIARVLDDPYEIYLCTWDDKIDLPSKNIITIQVSNNGDGSSDEEAEDDSDTIDPNSIDWNAINYDVPVTKTEEIDLSNGASETGILEIQCKPVYAFKSVTLTLQDASYQNFDVTLHLDPYFFKARVKLPAGTYRETGKPEIEYQENATKSGENYSWIRTGKTAFGGFFTIATDTTTSITDYEIVETIGGQAQSARSTKLLERTAQKTESELQQKQDDAFYEKAYQNLTVETTAEDQPQYSKFSLAAIASFVLKGLPFVIGIALILVAIKFILHLVHVYQENNGRH